MVRIALLTVSDRAARGEYEDLSGPAIAAWLGRAVTSPYELLTQVVPDGVDSVGGELARLCDEERVDLILTTGGTGPSPRDLTPEAMKVVLEKELPGFGDGCRLAGQIDDQRRAARAGRIETDPTVCKTFRPS